MEAETGKGVEDADAECADAHAIAGTVEIAMFGVSVSSALRFEEVDADEKQRACITKGLRQCYNDNTPRPRGTE